MTPQACTVLEYIAHNGSITAREALLDFDMTSATLARRICELEAEGFQVARTPRKHPVTGKRYTKYAVTGYRDPKEEPEDELESMVMYRGEFYGRDDPELPASMEAWWT